MGKKLFKNTRDYVSRELEASPIAAQLFGNAGREHMEKYGTKEEHFAKVRLSCRRRVKAKIAVNVNCRLQNGF